MALILFGAWPWTASAEEPPARPTGLTGTVAHDQVALSWDATDDSTITGYQILRRDKSIHERGEFIIHVDDTGNSTPSYSDTDVQAGQPCTASRPGTPPASARRAAISMPGCRSRRP